MKVLYDIYNVLYDIYNVLYKISDLIVLYNTTKGLIHEDLSIEYCSLGFKLSYTNIFKKVRKDYQKIETLYKKILDLLE